MEKVIFFDTEISYEDKKVLDIGAVRGDKTFHKNSFSEFKTFIKDGEYLCGHNIVEHDLKYIENVVNLESKEFVFIDTLYMSPLLFPTKPYHKLVKDDKLFQDELNNPLSDSIRAKELFEDEISVFNSLGQKIKEIYTYLLKKDKHFSGFLKYVNAPISNNICADIKQCFKNFICENANLSLFIENYPVELAYALAIIYANDKYSLTPAWVYCNYPNTEYIIKELRNTPCKEKCAYCKESFNIHKMLKKYFHYDNFREYEGEPLQEKTIQAGVNGESLLAIFPTGGGKSLTFQLPALMAATNTKSLTVIISPLQSLMKDQVDGLEEKGIVEAVTINGLLSPLERSQAIERVLNGSANLLYISPESLRSKTIEKILLSRDIARFVIDEAHCFSAWGQDFRVDYLYIGDFIYQLYKKKKLKRMIPISCFTATAKQKVVSDIVDYFRQKLGVELRIFATLATRKNLKYSVIKTTTAEEKYKTLRSLILLNNCPTIVYVSRTKRTREIAAKLIRDGISARPFNGKMSPQIKIENQEAFINNDVQVMVATSAFGMGVNKKDVGLVVHYDISDSLENYIQEAGRAGRSGDEDANCYILFNEEDLNKHFLLLNQTKVDVREINKIWIAIKKLTKKTPQICKSALEIAREAGISETSRAVEIRAKTALSVLEQIGFINRGYNVPHVYATSIIKKSMIDASQIIQQSTTINDVDKEKMSRIIKFLFTQKTTNARSVNMLDFNESYETRVDYIADNLALNIKEVVKYINLLKEVKILSDDKDLSAEIDASDFETKSINVLNNFINLERFMVQELFETMQNIKNLNYKELCDKALKNGIEKATISAIKTIVSYWKINGYIDRTVGEDEREDLCFKYSKEDLDLKLAKRYDLSKDIIGYLYDLADRQQKKDLVRFSTLELKEHYNNQISLFHENTTFTEIEHALLYLSKIKSIKLDGGFFVSYMGLTITRLVLDNKKQFTNEYYKYLKEFYEQKVQQIHIVGEFANMMVESYEKAMMFVKDYFNMEYKSFIKKYFKGREGEIRKSLTNSKYIEIYKKLSAEQSAVVSDLESDYIVVAAGPGSGKTKVLANKLAALLFIEEVKQDQLLMLTFSRSAAVVFKRRLRELIGNAVEGVQIKTFHSYCFDIVGKIGNLDESRTIIDQAVDMIENGEAELSEISKKVIVIDEAQDMDSKEFNLVKKLVEKGEDTKLILVGDDDQNIYEFRGSNSQYFETFSHENNSKKYELLLNYRSAQNVVNIANAFLNEIKGRIKTNLIQSARDDVGFVQLTKYINSSTIETPLVDSILEKMPIGTTGILTGTNEEALKIMGLLTKNGIKAKLIQNNDGFDLTALHELRFFINYIQEKVSSTNIITDNLWQEAVCALKTNFRKSKILTNCISLLEAFEDDNNSQKRLSDLKEFISESNIDDYVNTEQEKIIVSTLHKSKGREFDNVYILLNNYPLIKEENKRAVYVGMTRAKNNLFIHYTGDVFDKYKTIADEYVEDLNKYEEPHELVLQLGFRDVYLGYFKNKNFIIKNLNSGTRLDIDGDQLVTLNKKFPIARFSQKGLENLIQVSVKGYKMTYAEIRNLVYWRDKNDNTECLVVLPDIHFELDLEEEFN